MTVLTDTPEAADSAAWQKLVGKLDHRELAENFVTDLMQLEGYANSSIPRSAFLKTAQTSMRLLLKALRTDDPSITLTYATEVGTARARAKVPLDALITAIRNDYKVIWSALVSNASHTDAALLVRHTDLVWRTVDAYANQTREAYLAESKQLEYDHDSYRRSLLSELLASQNLAQSRLQFLAQELGLNAASYTVIAARGEEIAAVRSILNRNRHSTAIWCAAYLAESMLVVIPDSFALEHAKKSLRELPIGIVEEVKQLSEIQNAAVLARELCSVETTQQKSKTVEDHWPELAKSILDQSYLANTFSIANLAGFSSPEINVLLPTIQCYLGNGSIADTAKEMYCHRNTVTNRLHRFYELTGFDITIPKAAARVALMLANI